MFTARYGLSPYIKQTRLVFKGLMEPEGTHRLTSCDAARTAIKRLASLCLLAFTCSLAAP